MPLGPEYAWRTDCAHSPLEHGANVPGPSPGGWVPLTQFLSVAALIANPVGPSLTGWIVRRSCCHGKDEIAMIETERVEATTMNAESDLDQGRSEVPEGCHVEPARPRPRPHTKGPCALVQMDVRGMGCPACATRVRNALLAVPGVLDADVRLEAGLGSVLYDPIYTYSERLANVVFQAGRASHHDYQATVTSVRIMATPEDGSVATSTSSRTSSAAPTVWRRA